MVLAKWDWTHMMALGILNTMAPRLWQSPRYWRNGVNFSSTRITFDRLYWHKMSGSIQSPAWIISTLNNRFTYMWPFSRFEMTPEVAVNYIPHVTAGLGHQGGRSYRLYPVSILWISWIIFMGSIDVKPHTINQSINQSIHKSINQSIN